MSEVSGVYDGSPAGPVDTLDLGVGGAASRDVTPDDTRGWRLGGPVAYCALAAARLGLRVGCVIGVDGPAAAATARVECLRVRELKPEGGQTTSCPRLCPQAR